MGEMDNKRIGLIATITATLLCGFPGLVMVCSGLFVAISSTDTNFLVDPRPSRFFGGGILCAGVILLAIPVILGILTLRNHRTEKVSGAVDEPIPPPS